jgi:hypothetical protein
MLCLVLSIFVLGPIFTNLSLKGYFSDPKTWTYFSKNVALTDMQWKLPGVFEDSKYGLNGSLWTLPGEIRLYVCVALIFWLGSFQGIASGLAAIAVVIYAAVNNMLPYFGVNDELVDPIIMFGIGAGLSLTKKFVPMSLGLAIVGLIVPWLFRTSPAYHVVVYIGIAYAALYLFSRESIRRISLPGDYSYGVYLYGFPLQHVVAAVFPHEPLHVGTLIASVLALGLAAVSWHLCELPCNRLGVRIVTWGRRWGSSISGLGAEAITVPFITVAVLAAVVLAAGYRSPRGKPLAETTVPGLWIVDFGPHDILHGEPFNVQPNGASAIWVNVSRPVSRDAKLVIGATTLQTSARGTLLTAYVPPEAFSASGVYELKVVDSGGSNQTSLAAAWVVR